MSNPWFPLAILRAASLLAPADARNAWMEEWRSELWYVQPRGATRFSLGAFRDALWIRRHGPASVHFRSPASCLAMLAAVAAISLPVALRLADLAAVRTPFWQLRTADLPGACLLTLAISCLLAPAVLPTRLTTAGAQSRLRRAAFLTAKIALLQPLALCEILAWILIAPVAPFAPVINLAAWIYPLRWAFRDQQLRCPVCLRRLSHPVRLGTAANTLFEWRGAESVCSHGHGLLHAPADESQRARWLALDASWRDLFAAPASRRRAT